MKFFRQLTDVIKFMQLPKAKRRLVFYSEGKNYWPHLEGLVRGMLEFSGQDICYISSSEDDPGLFIEHPRFRSFKIDEGFIRNWLFENIDTDLMVMTMPDIEQYQVKRSKHPVHYIYVQHSLVSLHMVYRPGAFDHYDTIFCAGPYHVKEIRAIEELYNLPKKNIVEHGYLRLDDIRREARLRKKNTPQKHGKKHILIAPSWGPRGTIESGLGEDIVDKLISDGHKVTLRPHPQTIKFSYDKIARILKKHKCSHGFTYEANVAGQDSLHESDCMLSDWSGAALDYAFGLNKPVIFVDVPRKVNNPHYQDINIQPFEVGIREKVGVIISDIQNMKVPSEIPLDISDAANIFNVDCSAEVGCNYLMEKLNETAR